MSALRTLLLTLLAVCCLGAAAQAQEARVLDTFDSIAPWRAQGSDGVTAIASSAPGREGQALRLDFDFHNVSGYTIAALPDLEQPCRDADILAARLVQLGWNETNEITRLRNPSAGQMWEAFGDLSRFLNGHPPGRFCLSRGPWRRSEQ